ncbi:MAG: 2-C-methyl-D-erythritol 4-phosphate cytidylyltransferase, partial [Proteobacteria bacterium]|nr:2-C-methyl-D-erythritol 4-phosphate cytidylyltransferase [Pseudomonadota bacterium]
MRYWVVLPAAGAGRRFGGALPKQHWPLAASTVLEVALQPFLSDRRCVAIALVLDARALADQGLRARLPAKVLTVAGGAERADSVLNGLAALAGQGAAAETDWVLVHDAARPCLSARDLEQLLRVGATQAHGAVLAAPVTDTLKRATADHHCEGTVDRAGLWRALTPQMFRRRALEEALRAARAAGRTPTDEAQAMEWQGAAAVLVEAADGNIKITNREDLTVAAAMLAAR